MSQKTKQKRILLVDDNQSVLAILSDFLKGVGYAVYEAHSSQGAIEVVEENLPDLALIDFRMPGVNGIKLMRSLKKIRPLLRVIIYSGYPSMDTAINALKNGADDYVTKPFFLDELRTSIDQTFEKHESSRP